ncbi:transmembrane protein 51 [Coregonus clupeaformis]|uniref:transmembrane protein 51 n=1 Tax=Coregonus clupeaformis TaxID=59861 RepID=UPI001BE02AA1|nr:transmembrane protein 51 [Coregonus clupeaformis]XP_041743406.1 transmembrane protein 51 [Coregonus clupeaformis]
MCSSGGPDSSGHGGSRSGSSYALCALGVGLIALGIVMIVWTVVPGDASQTTKALGNFSVTVPVDHAGYDEKDRETAKTSSIAYVLVGAGLAMLLLSIYLAVRNKRRGCQRGQETRAVGVPFVDHVAGEAGETAEEPAPAYDVPSYEEVVTSGQYPIRQSNLRHSTSQLPSYEDLISAVEKEGEGPRAVISEDVLPTTPALAPQPAPAASANPPTRSSSRTSRLLRPLRVRRIKSEKLHLKDFRFKVCNPTDVKVTIEPITPPPQYDDKMPEF